MSLARSSSGPAGLTINTGAANSFGNSSFAQPVAATGGLTSASLAPANPMATSGGSAAAPSAGLFGVTQQSGSSTGLFGASTTQPAATGGALFGGGTSLQQNQPQQQSGGLFGQSAQQPQQQTGGLFGQAGQQPPPPQQQQQQQQAGGLFGQQPQPQPQQQQQQQPGGLFGQSSQQSQQPSGGLFGQSNQQQPQQPSGGLFGQSSQQSQQPSSGLFGQSGQQPQQQAAQTSTGLLGATMASPQPTAGVGSLFGQSLAQKPSTGLLGQSQGLQNQPATQMSAVQINYDNLRPRTRFDDLAQPVQAEIALIDKGIQRVIKMRDEIGEFMPQHEKDIEQLGRDVNFVESKFRTVQVALNRDIHAVKVLQDLTRQNIADAQLSFKATDNLKLPTHYHQTGLFAGTPPAANPNASNGSSYIHANAQDLITYFNRVCDDIDKYKKRLDEYRAEIERDMPGVENGLYEQIRTLRNRNPANAGAVQDQLGQVLSALRETLSAIVAQAGQIADTRERLSRLQVGIVDEGVYAMGTTA